MEDLVRPVVVLEKRRQRIARGGGGRVLRGLPARLAAHDRLLGVVEERVPLARLEGRVRIRRERDLVRHRLPVDTTRLERDLAHHRVACLVPQVTRKIMVDLERRPGHSYSVSASSSGTCISVSRT